MPIETYNPRANTFIKVPEVKCCPACGQPLPSDVKPMTNFMANYMHPVTGNVVCVNVQKDQQPTFTIKGEVYHLCVKSKETGKWTIVHPKDTNVTVDSKEIPVEKSPVIVPVSKLQAAQAATK